MLLLHNDLRSVVAPTTLAICAMVLIPIFHTADGRERLSNSLRIASDDLNSLLEAARAELDAADLPQKEIELRLKIVESVATVKSYFPHVIGGPPETRNTKYWVENDEGSYIPRGKPTQAINDLWRTKSGIRCYKLSTLVMLKGLIEVSDEKQLAQLDDMLRGKVIPNDLADEGIGTLFEQPQPKEGEVFQINELLPGDEIWFENPYFRRLDRNVQRNFYGQEGHHVFYVGDGCVMDMYSREREPIDEFRKSFLRWKSVRIVADDEDRTPKADEFQVKSVRRVIVEPSLGD